MQKIARSAILIEESIQEGAPTCPTCPIRHPKSTSFFILLYVVTHLSAINLVAL